VSATCGSSSVGYWKCNPTTGTWTTSTTYSDSSCTTKCGSSSSTTCTFVVNSLELPSRAAVSSAKIYLDGADTNKQGSLVTLENVPVGTHTLKATAKGYNDVTLSAPCTSAGGVKTYYMLFESSSSKPACTTSGACSGYAIASGCSAQASSSGFSSTYTWTKATSSSCSGSTPYCYCGKLKSSSTKTCQEACGGTFLCSATTPTGYTYKSSGDSYCKSINSALKCYCAKSSGSGDDEDNHPSWVTGCAEFCKWVNTGYASSCRTSCVDDSSWWRNHYAEADKYCAANQVCCCSVQRTGGSSSKSVSCSSYTSIDRDIHCDCDNERACYPWGVWSLSNADWYKAQCFQCCQAETCGQGSSGSKSSKEPNWDEPPGEQTPEDQGEEGDCPNLCANYNPAGWYSCQDSCTANGLHYLSGGDSYCQNEHEGNTAGNHCCCTPTGEDDDDSDGNSGDRTCQREAEIDIDFEESSYCAGRGNFFDLTIQFEYDGDEYDMNEGDFRVVVSGNCINTRTLKAYSDRDVFRDRGDGEFELEGGTYWFGDVCRRTFEVTGKFKDGSRSCEITESQSVNVRDCGDDDDDEPSTTCDEACNGRDWDCDDSCRDDEDHESDGDDWCEWDDSDNDRCCCEVEEEDDEPPTTCAEACGNRDSDCDDSCSDDEERERDGDDWCEWDDSDNDRCCCEVEEEQTETCEEACDGRDWDCDDSCSDDEEHESDGDDDCRAGERCCCEEGDGDDDDGETGEMNCVVTGCIESTITCDGTACSMPSLPCGGGIFSCNGPFACSGGTCTCRDATCQGKGTPDENDGEDDDQDDPQETQIKVDCPETCNNDEPCTCTIEGCLRGVAQFSGNALDIRTMVTKYHEIPIKILTRSPDTISIHPGNSGTLAFEAMCINPMANSDEVRISVN
ncbi:MAG: carboxypeptidase regulatory-like domain-containing protein, partial [Candidatus Aenigmarchaeota archaeon]|nr:carboxypeptidase regulatory-like domain-containing protein [Candidatus Aenigmarchaeota archaeon]